MKIVSFLLAFCVTFLQADDQSISFEAEVLFLKPCINDLDFAVSSPENILASPPSGTGKIEKFEPGFRTAFCLRAAKSDLFSGFGMALEYFYFRGENARHITREEGSIVPTLIHLGNIVGDPFNPNFAKAKWMLRFQTLDAVINYPFSCRNAWFFTPYFGAEALMINQMTKSLFTLTEESLSSRWESDFFGVGLVLGTRISWNLFDSFSIFTDVSARIIRGDTDADDHFKIELNSSPNQNFKFDYDDCLFVPGYKIIIGIEYAIDFCDKTFAIDAGYEFMQFGHVPNPRRYTSGNGGLPISTSPSTAYLGFHGGFLCIKLKF